MDAHQITAAFDDIYDHALVFHGYTDYMRDYDVLIYTTADPQSGIAPEYLRYRFKHCVRASVTTSVSPDVWTRSLDDRLLDFDQGCELDGLVWGVRWHPLYPGAKLLPTTPETATWSAQLGQPVHEATIETNIHAITLVFADLSVDRVDPGYAPFTVTQDD
ncbi:hypothetical protein [Kribbella ginsengisoli]|uniref:YxiG-like domain-containing protein n=1 Tax=Kribbella ginsengisoli TaxID=363865 RepID=A0ABP6WKG5_9ACTN